MADCIAIPGQFCPENSDESVVDMSNVQGGLRTVNTVSDLYTIPVGKLVQGVSLVRIGTSSSVYLLTDITNSNNATGWTLQTSSVTIGGGIVFQAKQANGITNDIEVGENQIISIPFNCNLIGYKIASASVGSVTIDVQKATYSSYPTFTSIVGSNPITLSSANKNQDNTLTGWTTGVSQGDFLRFVITSNSGVYQFSLTLSTSRTS